MVDKRRRLQVGDWFELRLPDGSVAVGHTVRVAGGGAFMLAYFFGPRGEASGQGCESLDPADATTALVCGGLGVTTGEWTVTGTTEVDPPAWPVPEFERRVPSPAGERLMVVTKRPDLVNDATTRTLNPEEQGLRPPDKLFGYRNVPVWLQHLRDIGLPPVGRQPWWGCPSPAPAAEVRSVHTVPDAVLVRLPATRAGQLEMLLSALDAATVGIGEVDGSLVGADEITIYLYGTDASRLASTTHDTLTGMGVADFSLDVRRSVE